MKASSLARSSSVRASNAKSMASAFLESCLKSRQTVLDEDGDQVADAVEAAADRLAEGVPVVDALQDHGELEPGERRVPGHRGDVAARAFGVSLDEFGGGGVGWGLCRWG